MQKWSVMVFKRYQWNIIFRVFLILVTCLCFSFFVLADAKKAYTIFFLLILILVQVVLLVQYLDQSNRHLARFLEYAREKDSTLRFTNNSREGSFKELGKALDEINKLIRDARIEKENHYQYLQYVLENVEVGLIAINDEGKIELVNSAFLKMLGISQLYSIRNLNALADGFGNFLQKLEPGERRIYKLLVGERLMQLAVKCSGFLLRQKQIRLISLQDIRLELEEKELDSWQKMIRILTHEIMNSITPITTMVSTLQSFFMSEKGLKHPEELSLDTVGETVEGLELVQERGLGLMEFVRRYKSLTRLPQPKFEKISVLQLLEGIKILMKGESEQHHIQLSTRVEPEELVCLVDERMMEQVLINLVRNSLQALAGRADGKIELIGRETDHGRCRIEVKDNGPGIPEDIMPQIFLPFFTTREQGSGIGLSLSRQILRLHKGTLSVLSDGKTGTVMIMEI